jgi:hypothetical protein
LITRALVKIRPSRSGSISEDAHGIVTLLGLAPGGLGVVQSEVTRETLNPFASAAPSILRVTWPLADGGTTALSS